MKKIVFAIALLLLAVSVFAVGVDRSMPSRIDPSSEFTVSFAINPEGTLTAFDLADFVPNGWSLNSWSVSGYSRSDVKFDSQVREYQGQTRNGLHWALNKTFSSPVTLSYTMTAPSATGSYEFIAVWTYPGGFNSRTSALTVGAAPSPTPTPTPSPTPTPVPESEQPPQDYTLAAALLVLIVIAGAFYMFRKPKKRTA